MLAENLSPTIDSLAPQESTAGAEFKYDVIASDGNLDLLTYKLTASPAEATIDSFGRVRWTPAMNETGDYPFEVLVTDPRGGSATQQFTLSVVEDTEAPLVSLIERPNDASRNILPWQGPFVVYAKANDNVAIASLTLTANGQDIALDAAGTATFTFEDWAFTTISATATAIDTSGNETTRTITFNYDFPEGWGPGSDDSIPTAVISSPSDNASVSGMVSIVGTADHEEFSAYRLSYRHIDDNRFTEFARDETAVTNGELGVWDTSLLINDEYVIRLEVATTEGVANVVEHTVGLGGELKLGNFQLSFTDMVIPVAGIPIEITRIYDTLQADRQGDFGYGWRLEYRDTDLRVGLPESGLEDIGIYSALRPGVKVFLNVPGQGRQGFTFDPDIRVLPGFGGNNLVLARPRFTPDPGVTSTLATGTSGYLQVNELGELYAPGGIPYNPASPNFGGAYVVTTPQGRSYQVDGATGELQGISDLNGNQLQFNDGGISSNRSAGVVFQRDAQGRVVSITDAIGNSVQYEYAGGDLMKVQDRNGNTTEFRYSPQRAHYIIDVIDSLGREVARTQYNEDGRLAQTISLNGSNVNITYDSDALTERVIDSQGRETFVQYDNSGNVIASTNALGETYRMQYNERGHLNSQTNPLGETIRFTHNRYGRPLSQIDAAGNTTHYSYSELNHLTGSIDAHGNASTFVYDQRGNLISETQPGRGSVIYERNDRGDVIAVVDPIGGRQEFTVDENGWVIQVKDAIGINRENSFDAIGRLTETSIIDPDNPNQPISFQSSYDANGNLVGSVDPLGNTFSQTFDSESNPIQVTDPTGRTATFDYESGVQSGVAVNGITITDGSINQDGLINQVVAADGQTTRFTYDVLGRPTSQATVGTNGEPTQSGVAIEYDPLGRPIRIQNGDADLFAAEYDLAGNIATDSGAGGLIESQFDALGRVVQETADGETEVYTYNDAGDVTSIKFSDGSELQFEYDDVGRLLSRSLDGQVFVAYQYDSAGQLVSVIDHAGQASRFKYNILGAVERYIDSNGQITRYEYDRLGRQTAVIRPDGSRSEAAYDEVGRLISRRDPGETETTYAYDAFDRVITRVIDGNTVQFSYDDQGRMVSMVDNRGTTQFEYTTANQLRRRTEPDGHFVAYQYDEHSNVVSIETNGGRTAYRYNENRQLIEMTDTRDGVSSFEYDEFGRRTVSRWANGATERLSYNEFGQVATRSTLNRDSQEIASMSYQYQPDGRVSSKTYHDGQRVEFTYNLSGMLTSETYFNESETVRSVTYTYDSVGNRITRNDSSRGVTNYVYNNNDQLIQKTESGVITEYQYDPAGNLLVKQSSNGDSVTYTWQSGKQLSQTTSVINGQTTVEVYLYDGFGVRVGVVVNGEETRYLSDRVGGLPEIIETYLPDGTVLSTLSQGAGGLVESEQSESQYSIHDDEFESYVITDDQTAIESLPRYTTFGEPLGPPNGTLRGFKGELTDEVSDLIYLRARYYDPQDGRFLSTDPFEGVVEQPLTRHDYVYAGNDPVNLTDPSGLSTLTEQLAALTINNTLFRVAAAQALVGAVASALGGTISWGGSTVALNVGDFNAGLSFFESEVVDGKKGESVILTLSKGVGDSISAQRTFSKRRKASRISSLESNSFRGTGAGQRRRQNKRDLKAARNMGLFSSVESLLGLTFGTATVFAPAIFGHTANSLNGGYLGLSAGASIGVSSSPSNGLTAGYGGSIGVSGVVYGFAFGYSVPDTGLNASLGGSSNNSFTHRDWDIELGFEVQVGISFSLGTKYEEAPNR
ncbi:MAG: RHS repeat-associated core domain-containing protein [Planctomycetota bacterium]